MAMKRMLFFLCVSLLTMTTRAQDKFTVPEPSDLQKYQLAALQWNGAYLIQINYAKSLGKPVSEVAIFVGDQLKGNWSKAAGFDSFVQGLLYLTVALVPYGGVEIIEQSDNKLVYRVNGFFSELKEGGSILNVNYSEFLEFWEIAFSRQADYLGAKYSQKDSDEGLIVTVRKR
jgi:hypothetical protein